MMRRRMQPADSVPTRDYNGLFDWIRKAVPACVESTQLNAVGGATQGNSPRLPCSVA